MTLLQDKHSLLASILFPFKLLVENRVKVLNNILATECSTDTNTRSKFYHSLPFSTKWTPISSMLNKLKQHDLILETKVDSSDHLRIYYKLLVYKDIQYVNNLIDTSKSCTATVSLQFIYHPSTNGEIMVYNRQAVKELARICDVLAVYDTVVREKNTITAK